MKFMSLIISLLISLQVFAGIGEDFRALKDSGIDYEVVGAICEEVTRLRFEEEYPSNQYAVVTGVEYSDGNRTIGELDVVVFKNSTQQVIRIAEVKCWKNTKSAMAKARDQRQRFLRTIQSGRQTFFKSLHSDYKFKRENFVGATDFIAVAQKGSKESGFDRELPYELKELMQLRKMMLECQSNHQCKPATAH
jgi:hypothetical protein